MSEHTAAILILGLPLLGFLLIPIIPGKRAEYSGIAGTLILAVSAVLSINLMFSAGPDFKSVWSATWINFGENSYFDPVSFSISLSSTNLAILTVVAVVSTLVHAFSVAYMGEDRSKRRYFSFLALFTFSMYGIVFSNNLLLLFVFWEMVGVSSYLLIGFWYEKSSAAAAGKKAFIVNRVADGALLLGILTLWIKFGSLDLSLLNGMMQQEGHLLLHDSWIWIGGLLVFGGAVGKSAQFPLQVWLPDAMEGPTPVSALLHAATMVTAGVILISKVFFILHIDVLAVIAVIGAFTTLVGGVAALAQYDIKKVLAYSTVSQLGYMMLGMGVGAYTASMFHLVTHAFFKAGLFLAAGAIIHLMHRNAPHGVDVQDMRNLGGLRSKMPVVFFTMLIFAAALAGLPFFSGFLSKDAILEAAVAWAVGRHAVMWLVPVMGFTVILLTALYMGRLVMLVFFGKCQTEELGSSFNPGNWITAPLIILAVASVGFVFSLNPFSYSGSWVMAWLEAPENLWVASFIDSPEHSLFTPVVSTILAVGGLGLGYMLYRSTGKGYRAVFDNKEGRLGLFKLGYNDWYLDRIYKNTIVSGVLNVSRGSDKVDRKLLDGFLHFISIAYLILANVAGWVDKNIVDGLVNLMARLAGSVGTMTSRVQGGRVQSYVMAAVLGLVIIILIIIV